MSPAINKMLNVIDQGQKRSDLVLHTYIDTYIYFTSPWGFSVKYLTKKNDVKQNKTQENKFYMSRYVGNLFLMRPVILVCLPVKAW